IRFHHFGEGSYAESERVIQELLAQAHHQEPAPSALVSVAGSGAEAPPAASEMGSPETYIGYERGERFDSPQRLVPDKVAAYSAPLRPSLNQWGLEGAWNVGDESAVLQMAP